MQTVISSFDDKKSKELFYLLKFKEIVHHFPKGKLELSESPDFLLQGDQNIIGIEMEFSKFDKIFFFDFKANHYVEW